VADIDYTYTGFYDTGTFATKFQETFSTSPRYRPESLPDAKVLLDLINRDSDVTDVRWAAYMLATTMWETTSRFEFEVQAKNKKGKPLFNKKGEPVMVKQKKWLFTMAPVSEVGFGAGRAYHEPVKIAVLADGSVRVTEHDGDQFSVGTDGKVKNLTKGAKLGAKDGAPAAKAYESDTGDENVYYGRGYVQLTWWSNYAKTGVALGKGLSLLTDPESVKTPEIAYAVMSNGMRTGAGFANGHKFSNYFGGKKRNYVGARKMVNGTDHAADIAAIAEKFEKILLDCRIVRRNAPLPFFSY